ncbi:pectate lyase [Olivibacter jilunii]
MVYCGFSSWLVWSLTFALCLGKGNTLYAQDALDSPLKWESNQLVYMPDSLGNRIPDFSYSGYKGGEEAIPLVEAKALVKHQTSDATATIQSAINYVAQLPLDQNGFRGAILLEKGTYQIDGSLVIPASGIVLRGSGAMKNGTALIGTGTSRETLIRIVGVMDSTQSHTQKIKTKYVPVNAMAFEVTNSKSLKPGDGITIHRRSSAAWIKTLGTDHFGGGITSLGWKPGQRDIYWDRKITKIEGNKVYIDAPITTALDHRYDTAAVSVYQWKGRIGQIGIENISLESSFEASNPKDEDHRWTAITMENVEDAWVRQVNFKHFAGSAVYVAETGKRITVEDCKSTDPISEIGGQRRNTFFTNGQQTLFQRLYAEYGYHDYAVGFMAAGPNAFVQCQAVQPFSFSGAVDSWSSGNLFDCINIDGQALRFSNLEQDGNGAGWAAANSVFWQCSAARVECYQPPTAQNWAFGTWAQFVGNAYWEQSNEHIKPYSLYYAQLSQRLDDRAVGRAILMPEETEASSSPSVEVAEELTQLAGKPKLTLSQFIDQASERTSISLKSKEAKLIIAVSPKAENSITSSPSTIHIENGWLVGKKGVLTGKRQDVQWWNGSARRYALEKARPHITRFVPGQVGNGLTDNLKDVVDTLKNQQVVAFEHNYGLWYDRRRDDHERIRRMDGDVWPPFYELPFARSGEGLAWDGLSKYDLTKYNKWYWSRLKTFANLAEAQDILLVHQNYFQHNIIEAGAHYADFPWRTANNINQTGFPEPPPYAGDKRIFMDALFYDVSNQHRAAIHRAYIRQCLNNFKENKGVLQLTGAEYTGPLHFVQFWLDVIEEWEIENKQQALIGLSTTKDVQDAILADAKRNKIVKVIDIRYWYKQADGSTYEPKGGQHLAPRQQARLFKPKKTSFEQVYQAVSTYREQYPDKAVIYSANGAESNGWAVFMGGGSLASIPNSLPSGFLSAASQMKPQASGKAGMYMLQGEFGERIIYADGLNELEVDLPNGKGRYIVLYLDPATGKVKGKQHLQSGKKQRIQLRNTNQSIVWIHRA